MAMEMDSQTAECLFRTGGVFILLDMPIGSQFGVDQSSWTTGEKFMGLKMIPPGVHFIFFSAISKQGCVPPRIGFFHFFHEKEVMVRRYDPQTEDLVSETITEEELDRYRGNLTQLDSHLAPYPYESYKKWFGLTQYITAEVIAKLQPTGGGRISAQADLISRESDLLGEGPSRVDRANPSRIRFRDAEGLPIMRLRDGTEIRFTPIPTERYPTNATPSEISQCGVDRSFSLQLLLDRMGTEMDLMGEVQFAYVCFINGHMYESFEHWKRLVELLCNCDSALVTHQGLYEKFIFILYQQLADIPKDFFVDIIEKNNFLVVTLTNFFSLIHTNPQAAGSLRSKAAKFQSYLTKKFKWNFDSEPDDFLPTVVGAE